MPPLLIELKEAGQAFSRVLTDHKIDHAFIGGFALNVLGSDRETLDIDVEVAMDDVKPNELRPRLLQLLRADQRFIVSNLKLFFVPDHWDLRVPIETLARGTLGLPRRLSILRPANGSIPILHPGVLILTKMKRSCQYIGSTRPQSVVKFNSDVRDIIYLLHWLQDHGMKMNFINYDAVSPERLYDSVRKMRAHWSSNGEFTTVQMLDDVLEESDQATIMN